jgi:predicted DCC family thiol-disulfide oxidoreductase YuxK
MIETPEQGCVLYDDSCGFCRRWIPFWSITLYRRGFSIAPLQSNWVRKRLGLPEAELVEDLRLLLPDGRQVRGADVYRNVMRRIWWAWLLYLFAIMPVGRQTFDWGYRTFARNRFRFSRACGLRAGSTRSTERDVSPGCAAFSKEGVHPTCRVK